MMTDCRTCGIPSKYLKGVRKLRKQIECLEKGAQEQRALMRETLREMSKTERLNKRLTERNAKAEGKLRRLRDAISNLGEIA